MREAFPTLPDRSQFNRLVRYYLGLIEAVALHLVEIMKAQRCLYEVLDTSAMPIRDAKRRGKGWLASYADIGWSNRLGWYEGFCLLLAVNPKGVVTGFGFCIGKHQGPAVGRDVLRPEAPSPDPRLPRA